MSTPFSLRKSMLPTVAPAPRTTGTVESRAARLVRLARAVKEGRFVVDAEGIADAILARELDDDDPDDREH
jgi:anti-sigma28 factor (negative regulator of flagellin synthesis)